MWMSLLLPLLAACTEVTPCGDGFQRADDGSCYAYENVDPTVDADGDGYTAADDCSDDNAAVNPAAEEVCNHIDDDCDGEVDLDAADALPYYDDLDLDGYGDPMSVRWSCSQGPSQVDNDLDCDDTTRAVRPGTLEVSSDGIDQDCDGEDRVTRVIAIASPFVCAIDAAGRLSCWGEGADLYGVVSEVPDGRFMEVGAGYNYACALSLEGEVTCWGLDSVGQVSGAPAGVFARLTVGTEHACVLDSAGLATCWGPEYNWSGIPASPLTALSAGHAHTCGILPGGSLACRGGAGSEDAPAGAYLAVSAGHSASCALDAEGQPHCWKFGSLPSGLESPPPGGFVDISVGDGNACAIAGTGSMVCWGRTARINDNRPSEAMRQVNLFGLGVCGMSALDEVICW